jgi:hypothetical protein
VTIPSIDIEISQGISDHVFVCPVLSIFDRRYHVTQCLRPTELINITYFIHYQTFFSLSFDYVNETISRITNKFYFQSHIRKVPLPLLSTRFLYIANELFRKERSPVATSSKIAAPLPSDVPS